MNGVQTIQPRTRKVFKMFKLQMQVNMSLITLMVINVRIFATGSDREKERFGEYIDKLGSFFQLKLQKAEAMIQDKKNKRKAFHAYLKQWRMNKRDMQKSNLVQLNDLLDEIIDKFGKPEEISEDTTAKVVNPDTTADEAVAQV